MRLALRWATYGSIVLTTIAATAQQPSRLSVRFHHLHYLVADPGAALGPAAEKLGGTRALLPGLGVGVRVGREYVLLDRATLELNVVSDFRPLGVNAPDEALRWLQSQGLSVEPSSIGFAVAAVLPADAVFDHLAFAADDLGRVLAAIKDTPIARTDDVARFRLASGSIVEIVRDTDRPDAYWCPMHPDVRRPGEEKCPRCGMKLVPIPAPRLGEYHFDVTMAPRLGGGASGLSLTVRDPETGKVVPAFLDVHERPLHLFIVSRDLETFAHVHPERRADGSFAVRHDLAPGVYEVIADFLPVGGTSQLLQRIVVTPGYTASPFSTPPAGGAGPAETVVNGLRIRIDASAATARRASAIRFQIADAVTGAPIVDLEPYLGAPGHVLVVSPDLTFATHAHPAEVALRGPTVTFEPLFPAPGVYKVWAQFQRKGQVVTAPFVIDVP